jgi:superfamily II DNA or RNA helicase
MHRQFVEASAKFKLLEIMLPKLQEQGHRVLIFSQFLEMLSYIEDFLDGLNMQYTRLDGSVGVIEKQKRIDKFNAPESTLFAFLLSTRAGGVGINLATADTVIIMDPDFNPHQDLQALSRAHRIGQKNKVLVFNLVTKNSVEEKIVQIGRKKMALDHVLIEAMDQDQEVGVDLQSILKHGASAIFEGDDTNDIRYDGASVEKLLDRSHIENIEISESAGETQFSFAKVWQNDKGDLSGDIGDADLEEPVSDAWQKILAEREEAARKEELERQQGLGRGKRARQVYSLYSLLRRYNLTQSRP